MPHYDFLSNRMTNRRRKTYLNKDETIDSLKGLVRASGQIFVNVAEIRHEHVLYEMFILLNVVFFQEHLAAPTCIELEVRHARRCRAEWKIWRVKQLLLAVHCQCTHGLAKSPFRI